MIKKQINSIKPTEDNIHSEEFVGLLAQETNRKKKC